jgi:hypothetical protein
LFSQVATLREEGRYEDALNLALNALEARRGDGGSTPG